jgi:uncharacterized protein (UPF0333 family)
VEAVYSKEKSFVEHLLPWQLQSKQYTAMVKECHATESARIGTNIGVNCLRNFTVIFNNGLYSSYTFKDICSNYFLPCEINVIKKSQKIYCFFYILVKLKP